LSFWVVMSLPVSFLGAFFFFTQMDLTINMLTMVGLLLAIGLLMDDGVVIAENIASHAERGRSSVDAAVEGTLEVAGGVVASFLTTVCILGPLILVGLAGEIGKALEVIPTVLILVMAVSLVEAFLILPAHLAHSVHDMTPESRPWIRRKLDQVFDWTRENVLGRCVDALLQWRYLWIGAVIAMFAISVGMVASGAVKFLAFPELDGDVVVARVLLPPGTPLERTEEITQRITDALEQVNRDFASRQPKGQDLVRNFYVQFNYNEDAFETGPHTATVYADLLDAEARDARIDDVLRTWREHVGEPADTLHLIYAEPMFGPAGRPLEIRVQGDDLEELKAVAVEMQAWFSQFEGVHNLSDDLRAGKPEARLRLREGALGLNLDAATVANQLRTAFHGDVVDEIQVGSEGYEVDVRLRRTDQDSVADVESFQFVLPDGQLVPLRSVVDVERGRGWSRIARHNGLRAVTLRGDVDARRTNTEALIHEFRQELLPKLQEKHPHVLISVEGSPKRSAVTKESMKIAFFVGVLGIFVVLSFQFRGYVEPLIVMAAIPFAVIGVIWGHVALGHDLSMPSLLGFVSLAGIVVNDSILLVLFLKERIADGADLLEAASQASRQRFRAIMITSLTTIVGLTPLMMERSLQAQVMIPLAISIVFGLMASTV
ncbi:MAG: efflux RND transporter permease subunit, partial [Planctomycetales bacterium]